MSESGLVASEITVAECHGTGTALGDPIEVSALRAVMEDRGRPAEATRVRLCGWMRGGKLGCAQTIHIVRVTSLVLVSRVAVVAFSLTAAADSHNTSRHHLRYTKLRPAEIVVVS